MNGRQHPVNSLQPAAQDSVLLSVILTTFNRPELLERCLDSLAAQSLPREQFEVVVVDDGSTPPAETVVARFQKSLKISYFRQENAGLAAARSAGILMASGSVIVPLDDDLVCHPEYLAGHATHHRIHPGEDEAMLARLEWDPGIAPMPLLRHVTEIDPLLWSSPGAVNGEELPFGSLWGGCSSYKRTFVLRAGLFDSRFTFGYEDTEAELRMRRIGLRVRLNARAVAYVTRPVSFDDMCRRSYRQGRSLRLFAGMYASDPVVQDYATCHAGELLPLPARARYSEINDAILTMLGQGWNLPEQSPDGKGASLGMLYAWLSGVFAHWKRAGYEGFAGPDGPAAAGPRVIVAAPELPAFDRSSGAFRLHQILRALSEGGAAVTFIARAPVEGLDEGRYFEALERLGIEVFPIDTERIRAKWGHTVEGPALDVPALLRARSFDVSWLCFYELASQYIPLIRRESPRTRIIVDSVDLHFLREGRKAILTGDSACVLHAETTRREELEVYRSADEVITVTQSDRQALLAAAPGLIVDILPNIHPLPAQLSPLAGRSGALFIGNFLHEPNVDAVCAFVRDVWPLVLQKIPGATCTILGPHAPAEVTSLASASVIVPGYVPDTQPFLDRARVSIAPLRYGAGMKGKVGEALAAGLPVVATPIAAEGMGILSPVHALVAENGDQFAEAMVRLLTDDVLWHRISDQGRRFIADRYTPEQITPVVWRLTGCDRSGRAAIVARGGVQAMERPAPAGEPECSIIIPTLNNSEMTRGCLESIRAHSTGRRVEIIIVDNGSTDGTVTLLNEEESRGTRVIRNSSPATFSRSCNQGAAVARARLLVFLNNDTSILPGWLEALTETFAQDARIGIQGAKLLYPDGTIQHAGIVYGPVNEAGQHLHYHLHVLHDAGAAHVNTPREFQMVTGAFLAVRTDVFRNVHGFDERYIFGHEDLDLCMKVRAAGFKVWYNPRVAAVHYESATKKLVGLEKFERYITHPGSFDGANDRYFHAKWDDVLESDAEKYYREDSIAAPFVHARKPEAQKPRILFTMYGWNESGGGTTYPRAVACELARRGYEVSVFYASLDDEPARPSCAVHRHVEHGVRLFGLVNRNAKFTDPDHPEREILDAGVLAAFAAVVDEIHPDIVHFQNFHGLTFALAEEISRRGIRSCYTPHNYHMIDPELYLIREDLSLWDGVDVCANSAAVQRNSHKSGIYERRATTTRRLLNEWVGVTLAVSQRQRDLLVQHGGDPKRIAVVHQANPVADALWQNRALDEIQGRAVNRPVRFGFIGGVMPHKGVHMIAAAAQRVAPEEAEFHIYGFAVDSYAQQLRAIDAKGRLIFHGPYAQEHLAGIAASLDVAIVPSVWEDCAPLVLLELEAMRLPVIVSRIGGIPDFVHEGVSGVLYAHDDVDDLLRCIRKFTAHTEYVRSLRAGRRQSHSFERYMHHLEHVYAGLLHDVPGPAHDLLAERGGNVSVVWEGSQFVHHSLALVNRELCLRLASRSDIDLSVEPYEPDEFTPNSDPRLKAIQERVSRPLQTPADVHVRHLWPPVLTRPPQGRWVVIQPWEFGSLPRTWTEVFTKSVDEIWVPSSFVRDCYVGSGVPAGKVVVIPNGVDTGMYTPDATPLPLTTGKRFKFLFVGGTIFRKGIDILLKAYAGAFTRDDDVCLVIKDLGNASFYRGINARSLIDDYKSRSGAPEIEYIDHTLRPEEMAGLYTACNCLVHPYRGEGFGLPIAEAMAAGLPVIVTGGGGARDFCSAETATLIPSRKVKLPDMSVGDLETVDYPWLLEPDADALMGLLRRAVNDPEGAASKATAARELILREFTWEAASDKVARRLHDLAKRPRLQIAEHSCRPEISLLAVIQGQHEGRVAQFLSNVRAASGPATEVLLVPRDTTAGILSLLHETASGMKGWTVLGQVAGEPLHQSWNRSGSAARGDLLAFLHDDISVPPSILDDLAGAFHGAHPVGIVAPLLLSAEGREAAGLADEEFRTRNRHNRVHVWQIPRTCFMIRRDVLGAIDGFREEDACDSTDLVMRVSIAGSSVLVAGDTAVHSVSVVPVSYGSMASPGRRLARMHSRYSGRSVERAKLDVLSALADAEACEHRGRSAQGVQLLSDTLARYPESPALHSERAWMLLRDEKYDEVSRLLPETPESVRRHPGWLDIAGFCMEGLGELALARECAQKALAIDSKNARAWLLSGMLAVHDGDAAQAEVNFREAIAADPSSGEPVAHLGALLWTGGNVSEAEPMIERAFALAPTRREILSTFSALAVRPEYAERAERIVNEARALFPRHGDLMRLHAGLLEALGRDRAALDLLKVYLTDIGLDGQCLDAAYQISGRTGPRETDGAHGTISLCMIVRDEEEHLARCLASADRLADEIVIVDTGSTDRSPIIASVFGARVFAVPWTDDFAAARNRALERARGEWILVLDADEVLSPEDHRTLRRLVREQRCGISLTTRNYVRRTDSHGWRRNDGAYEEEAGTGWIGSSKVRLFPRDPVCRFENAVHEIVEPSLARAGIPVRCSDVPVHHYGRLDAGRTRRKAEHYAAIGRRKLAGGGGEDFRAMFELAAQEQELEHHPESADLWRRYLSLMPGDARGHLALGVSLAALGSLQEARDALRTAMRIDPAMPEAAVKCALTELQLGDADAAVGIMQAPAITGSDSPYAVAALAAALLCAGKSPAAGDALARLAALRIDSSGFFASLAHDLGQAGQHAFAATLEPALRPLEQSIG